MLSIDLACAPSVVLEPRFRRMCCEIVSVGERHSGGEISRMRSERCIVTEVRRGCCEIAAVEDQWRGHSAGRTCGPSRNLLGMCRIGANSSSLIYL